MKVGTIQRFLAGHPSLASLDPTTVEKTVTREEDAHRQNALEEMARTDGAEELFELLRKLDARGCDIVDAFEMASLGIDPWKGLELPATQR